MRRRRGLLLAILIYVALDLSLPAMPGAFVFEPADSAESIQVSRGRGAGKVVPLPTLQLDRFVVSQPRLETDRTPSAREVAPVGHRLVHRLPRAILDAAPPSEDSH